MNKLELQQKLKDEGFVHVYEWRDEPGTTYESHAHKEKVSMYILEGGLTFTFPDVLKKTDKPRFVNIGLTFSNYDPGTILSLLSRVAGENGFMYINAHMRDRVDMDALQAVYQEDAKTLADEKLQLIGLNPKEDVTPSKATQDIKVWCSVLHPNQKLIEMGVKEEDKFLLFQSLRYTKGSLEEELKKSGNDFKLFDIGAPFISTIIKT